MQKTKLILNPFFSGILAGIFLLLLYQCNKSDDPLFDSYQQRDLNPEIDYAGINKTGRNIEKLLKNADLEGIDELLEEESAILYGSRIQQYSDEELADISDAFKKRTLIVATEDFAEYSYEIDGVEYTLAIGQIEEGDWKIIRY